MPQSSRLQIPRREPASARSRRPPARPALAREAAASTSPRRGACACGGGCPRCAGDGASAGSGGKALEPSLRRTMEQGFGEDFGAVRVHDDRAANRAASDLGAAAFAQGNDLTFARHRYRPESREGQKLIAHELAHVVQQRAGAGPAPQAYGVGGDGSGKSGLEAEADRAADRVLAGQPAAIRGQAGPAPQLNPGWNSDELTILVNPVIPATPPQISYIENGYLHQRMSHYQPLYQGPFCQNVSLPFQIQVEFRVDDSGEARPTPFTPPSVSVALDFAPPGGTPVSQHKSDPAAAYAGQDLPLTTSFGPDFNMTLAGNGPLDMDIRMNDPDSGITRRVQDRVMIESNRPCT